MIGTKQFLKTSVAATMFVATARARFEQARRSVLDDERGASTVEYVLLVAGAAAMAIVVIAAVRAVATDTSTSIPTDVDLSTN